MAWLVERKVDAYQVCGKCAAHLNTGGYFFFVHTLEKVPVGRTQCGQQQTTIFGSFCRRATIRISSYTYRLSDDMPSYT